MAKVSIVYHSGYGHTKKLAEAVLEGAASVPNTTATLIAVQDLAEHWETLNQSDAIIMGAPTYMGSLSAPFKQFMDDSSKIWMAQKWKDKVAAGFTNSGSPSGDKLTSLIQLAVFAAQHSMIWVGLDVMPGNNTSTSTAEGLNRLGSTLGMMSQSNVDQPADLAPPRSDLETGKALGARVAQFAHRLQLSTATV
ncbi:MAG: flavodoxin family protein [Cyanobacteria bacterium]|nr:flavodoxin family protein [Cyanobacteriota bacterium]